MTQEPGSDLPATDQTVHHRRVLFRALAAAGAVAVAVAVALVGNTVFSADANADSSYSLPPAGAKFDYQIGANYAPPGGVVVVSRDRGRSPEPGLYNICYVNAFQSQPAETAWWQANHDDLLLRDSSGSYVIDSEWNEVLFDISTPEKRGALAAIVNGWIDGCATSGFAAVEADNLDSYTRSAGLLNQSAALSFASLLVTNAHDKGLAFGQKNTLELGTAGKDAGMDFAVVEECGENGNECPEFVNVYGNNVIIIEYTSAGFATACGNSFVGSVSIVLRDKMVTAPGSSTYVYEAC